MSRKMFGTDTFLESGMSEIGARIKQWRRMLGLTQKSLAEILSISRSHVANLEAGNSEPSDHLLSLISEKFPTINPDWLKHGGEATYHGQYLSSSSKDELRAIEESWPFRLLLSDLPAFSQYYDEVTRRLTRDIRAALRANPAFCPPGLVDELKLMLSKRDGEFFQLIEKLLGNCDLYSGAKNGTAHTENAADPDQRAKLSHE